MVIKNKYLYPEEVKKLLDNIPTKKNYLKSIIIYIYEQGKRLREAINLVNPPVCERTLERNIKSYSNGLIGFMDLRRSYLFSNPHRMLKKYKRKRIPISPKLRWKVLCKYNRTN